MRIRLSAAVSGAALLLSFGPAAGSPAAAARTAARAHARYVVVTGDDKYLIYAEAVRHTNLDPVGLPTAANLYALGRTGGPIALGTVGSRLRVISLSRSSLVVVNKTATGHRVRWWVLGSAQHGDISTNEDVVGATPDGWITKDGGFADGTHVVSRSHSGDLVDYGNPLGHRVGYGVVVGPTGFVAYADNFVNDNGEVTYTSWHNASRHRTLLAPGGKNVRCDSVSSGYAGCVIGNGASRAVERFALSGGSRTATNGKCADRLTVWDTELAWNVTTTRAGCPTGHATAMTSTGSTRSSKQPFNSLGVTVAWGRLVTAAQGQGELVTLTAVRAKPHPLSRADVS
ncbi:MAG TPA: hypothetical protein VG650_01065 [Mycobacteriales bacterium]|nr:hypothetical protein [Mycobacteriales bacterium]